MKTGTVLSAILLIGLVSSSFLLGNLLSPLTVWTPPVGQVQSVQRSIPLKYGVLAVGVMLSTPSTRLLGDREPFVPMQNAHIWLALPDHTLTRLLFLYTNSSGFVSMKLLPYRYLIEIFDPHLETSALVQVYEGMTTTLTGFASGSNHPIAFQEVHNQNVSGWVPSTGSIYVGIRSDARVANVKRVGVP